MAIYIINVFLTFFLANEVARYKNNSNINEKKSLKKSYFFLFLILLLWCLIATFRGTTGSDAQAYRNGIKNAYYYNYSFRYLVNSNRDKLYQLLVWIVANLFNGSWQIATAFISLLCYAPILYLVNKYSPNIRLSLLLYIFFFSFFYNYNGTREAISASFVSLAYYTGLREKRYYKYIFLMAISIGFHAAAMFVIPFHLISSIGFKSKLTKTVLFLFFIGSFFIFEYWDKVLSILDFLGQDKFVSSYYNLPNETLAGSGLLRTIVYFCPPILGFVYYKRVIKKYPDASNDIVLCLFQAIVMVYSMRNASLSQIGEYFSFSSILFLTKTIQSFENNRKIMELLVTMLFFIYMVAMLLHGEYGVYPYVPVWISGMY